ncbi:MAG TPA: hypothetical protein VJ807_01805 [Gaiellaceae bacterium]|nr:hypothetical protein [Gaiellaceae bacterium]
MSAVVTPPDGLTLKHHRDFEGLQRRPVARWAILAALGVLVALGLLNTFGQRPENLVVSAGGAELEVYSPTTVRSGIYFMSRFTIVPEREIADATLVLDSGWLEGMTLNTVAPSPVGEANRDGRVAFELGRIPAAEKYVLFLHFQVNPTNVGRRPQDVDLFDGDQLLVHVDREITIFP